ncbi:MAG TPA: transcription termination factor Rho [Frankiaceae bacterium]|nr:transcription termination factor Rho [Frankiaceae bacterium]
MSEPTDLLTGTAPEPDAAAGAPPVRARRRATGLAGMLLPELQTLAASLHIPGTARMRKGELIAAIQLAQGAGGSSPAKAARSSEAPAQPTLESQPPANGTAARRESRQPARENAIESNGHAAVAAEPAADSSEAPGGASGSDVARRRRRSSSRPTGSPEDAGSESASDEQAQSATRNGTGPADDASGAIAAAADTRTDTRPDRQERQDRQDRQGGQDRQQGDRGQQGQRDRNQQGERGQQNQSQGQRDRNQQGDRAQQGDRNQQGDRGQQNQNQGQGGQNQGGQNGDYDEFGGSRRRGRFRERRPRNGRPAGQGGGYNEAEPIIREDDVLVPIAGILDILDSYAFVRTSGYLTGPNDVYVSLAQVRRYGLRRGDAITGAVRQPQEGEKKDKYNAMVRLDTINGLDPEEARKRPEFTKLTPLYPNERLRLETEPNVLTTRVIDLVMPLGKGQRALIVSPPKAGKTMVLQAIANAITTNNPECHLMVVLVDERPEEVTDMQRSVKGEVIASTFDRPPTDHTSVAELSIERAKRLVEMGHDVVVLLDSITRLGRAYNLAAPTSGRILSGGVDSTALYPPKRFLGAARNIEHGGSLTILATALVETGSTMDTVIFEEFKGTGNAELKLDRRIADKRIFPAVDVDASGTRKEELLLSPEELGITYKLRRVLHALDSQQGIELLLDRLKQTRTNYEFLMQIAKTTPGE